MRRLFAAALTLLAAPLPLSLTSQRPTAPIYPVLRELEAIRGLPLLHPVDDEWMSVDEVREALREDLDEELPDARARAAATLLTTLRLLPHDYDLRAELLALLTEQVAGFYDSESKRMVLVELSPEQLEAFPELASDEARLMTLVHELDHALTDQHFDLDGLVNDPSLAEGHDDVVFARRCLAEGDAMLVMLLHALREMGLPTEPGSFPGLDAMLDSMEQLLSSEAAPSQRLDAAPEYVQTLLVEPYVLGLRLVMTTWRRGGFAAVDALWRDPPRSTEQVLHPERWDDLPTTIRDEPVGEGWERQTSFQLGELMTRVWLSSELDAPEAEAAAEGWDGDRLWLDRRPATESERRELGASHRPRLTYVSRWDSLHEADEFLAALEEWLWKVGRRSGIEDWRLTQHGAEVRLVMTLQPEIPEQVEQLRKDRWDSVEFTPEDVERDDRP